MNESDSSQKEAVATLLSREADSSLRVAGAALVLSAGVLLSRLSGLAREIVFAHMFGVSRATDAYVQAFRIPDLLYFLMAGGALAAGFIPVLTDRLTKNKAEEAWRTLSALFTLLLVSSSVLVAAGMLFAPALVHLVGPDFDAYTSRLCAQLMRIILPAQVFFVLGGLLMGTLHSMRIFVWSALAPTTYNVFIILGALIGGPHWGVKGQAVGALIGALAGQIGMQLPIVVRRGAAVRLLWDLKDPGLLEVLRLVLPVALGLCVFYLNTIAASVIAQSIGRGAASVFNYAFRLINLPLGLFTGGLAMSLFPTLSSHAARGEESEFRRRISQGIRQTLFLDLPAAGWMMALAAPLVRALLLTGHFDAEDVRKTASLLAFFALAIPAVGTQQLVARAFYALRRNTIPVVVGAPTVLVGAGLTYLLSRWLGLPGVGLGQSLVALANAAVLLWLLRGCAGGLHGRDIVRTGLLSLLATALAVGAGYLCALWLSAHWPPLHKSAQIAQILASLCVTSAVYLTIAFALRMREATFALQFLRAKLLRRP
jgi:putative peptidoglycan lipid II flippase